MNTQHPAFMYDEDTLADVLEGNLVAQFNHFELSYRDVSVTFRESVRFSDTGPDITVWDADLKFGGNKVFNVKDDSLAELIRKLETTAAVARKVSDEERIMIVEGTYVIIGKILHGASRLQQPQATWVDAPEPDDEDYDAQDALTLERDRRYFGRGA